jgi:hypothetical protein
LTISLFVDGTGPFSSFTHRLDVKRDALADQFHDPAARFAYSHATWQVGT